VFSVGSITWVAALFVDDAVSAITRNVLVEFAGRAGIVISANWRPGSAFGLLNQR